ncbi:MAG TPA: hypothetical protein VN019_02980 [Oxalicibacterium sp.]|nr:hypothetical protein [Oxalicibacterium sp.]
MSRTPVGVHEGFEIFVMLVPLEGGRWSATSEVEREGAEGLEVFQEFGGPCDADSADAAREAVLADTRHKIDDLLAEPER